MKNKYEPTGAEIEAGYRAIDDKMFYLKQWGRRGYYTHNDKKDMAKACLRAANNTRRNQQTSRTN